MEQKITEILEGVFEKLGAKTYGENYSILDDARTSIEEIVSENNQTEELQEELEELKSENGDLEARVDQLEDRPDCTLDCKKCEGLMKD